MASREVRFERKLKGLCPECGKVSDREGYYRCSKCSEQSKRRNERKAKAGICVRCSKPASEGKTLCKECAERNHAVMRRVYAEKRERRICARCGRRTAFRNHAYCDECLEINAERQREYRKGKSEEFLKEIQIKNNASDKKRRQRFREQGICTKCGKRKATVGYRTCYDCRAKALRTKKEYDKRHGVLSYTECIENGICTRCHKRKTAHGKVCAECYDALCKQLEYARSQLDISKTYWFADNSMIFLKKSAQGTLNSPTQTTPH